MAIGSDVHLECIVESSPFSLNIWFGATENSKQFSSHNALQRGAVRYQLSKIISSFFVSRSDRAMIHPRADKYTVSRRFINENKSRFSLTILNLDAGDIGEYTCKSMNTRGEDEIRFLIEGNPFDIRIDHQKVKNYKFL